MSVVSMFNSAFGQTWIQQTNAPINNWIGIASSADGTKVVAAAAESVVNAQPVYQGIYASTNSGLSWSLTGAPITNWTAVASSADGNKLVAAGGVFQIYISFDSGASWSTNTTTTPGPIASIVSSADGMSLVALFKDPRVWWSLICLSTNTGTSWTQAIVPKSIWEAVASSADGHKLIAVGSTIYTSTNSGTTWVSSNVTIQNWKAVASSADGNRFLAAVYGGGIYISTNSGIDWTQTNAPNTGWQAVASSADGSRSVAAVYGGGIYISTNSGINWTQTDAPNFNWKAVASSADGNQFVAVAYGGGIWTYQTTPAPQLNLTPSPTNIAISWLIPSTNFVLQQSSDLISWSSITDTPTLNLTNLNNELSISPTNSTGFYRLSTP